MFYLSRETGILSTNQGMRHRSGMGWWYVLAEEVLGKVCKSCNASSIKFAKLQTLQEQNDEGKSQ
jgi:hypothetical protein